MTQDNPCLAYRFMHNATAAAVFESQGWTAVRHSEDVRNARIVLSYFPLDDELIQIEVVGSDIAVTHELLTSTGRVIPIPVNFNNPKIAAMLEYIWLYSDLFADGPLGGKAIAD